MMKGALQIITDNTTLTKIGAKVTALPVHQHQGPRRGSIGNDASPRISRVEGLPLTVRRGSEEIPRRRVKWKVIHSRGLQHGEVLCVNRRVLRRNSSREFRTA